MTDTKVLTENMSDTLRTLAAGIERLNEKMDAQIASLKEQMALQTEMRKQIDETRMRQDDLKEQFAYQREDQLDLMDRLNDLRKEQDDLRSLVALVHEVQTEIKHELHRKADVEDLINKITVKNSKEPVPSH